MRALAAILLLLPGALGAQGAARLLCRTAEGAEIAVLLSAPSRFGAAVHCVEAPELRDRVAACAPDGGWGLSAGDGSQDLLGLAVSARGLAHVGGWFFARLGPSEFVASASVGSRPPLALETAGETFWRMRLTLATGEGVVETPADEVALRCEGG